MGLGSNESAPSADGGGIGGGVGVSHPGRRPPVAGSRLMAHGDRLRVGHGVGPQRGFDTLPRMAPDRSAGEVTGFRSRLEAVDGVESIELALGDDGLEGITVRLSEGADEVAVLEGIRRLLVAYGTKTPREPALVAPSGAGALATPGVEEPEPEHEIIDLDEPPSEMRASDIDDDAVSAPTVAHLVTLAGDALALSVLPTGNRSSAQVSLSVDDRTARRQVPASARAIVQATIDVGTELVGHDPISVIGMNLSAIDGTRVLTVIVGNHGSAPRVCTASVIEHDWPGALLNILSQVLGDVLAGE